MTFQYACQTITWGEDQAPRFNAIFRAVASAGFRGVEIGYRHIRTVPPCQLKEQLSAHGLEDLDQAGEERGLLDDVMDYLSDAGANLLMYSGLKADTAVAVADDIAMLGRAAERAAARGMRLLYHNHQWEFRDSGIMDALLAAAPPCLGLCPDIAWLMRGGVDIPAFLRNNASRIGAVHFKDFATSGTAPSFADTDTVPLGCGVVPLRETAAWLRDMQGLPDPLWITAEQDVYEGSADEAAAINGRFLHEVLGMGAQ
jgi:sugar phosphate isomerase/epimerase